VVVVSAWRTSSTAARHRGARSAARKRSVVALMFTRLCSDRRFATHEATSCSSLVADVAVRLTIAIRCLEFGCIV
jgi:hypothetical protein